MIERYNAEGRRWETVEGRWDDAADRIVEVVTASRPATAGEIAIQERELAGIARLNADGDRAKAADAVCAALVRAEHATGATVNLLAAYRTEELEAGGLPGLTAQLACAYERAITALEALETARAAGEAAEDAYRAATARLEAGRGE